MNRTRMFLALLAVSAAFTSCKRDYICTCEIRPGVQLKQTTLLLYEIKAKDREKATQLCDANDNINKDCSLE